jgi:hypothetical protein
MRGLAQTLALAGVFSGAFFFSATIGEARLDFSRRTGKECSFCHPGGSWNLNDAGKYCFEHKHSLQGYVPPAPAKPDAKKSKS